MDTRYIFSERHPRVCTLIDNGWEPIRIKVRAILFPVRFSKSPNENDVTSALLADGVATKHFDSTNMAAAGYVSRCCSLVNFRRI